MQININLEDMPEGKNGWVIRVGDLFVAGFLDERTVLEHDYQVPYPNHMRSNVYTGDTTEECWSKVMEIIVEKFLPLSSEQHSALLERDSDSGMKDDAFYMHFPHLRG